MANGIKSLLETTKESDIVDLGEELNRPNVVFPTDQEYGIQGKYRDYALMICKTSGRKGKEEDGENNGKTIRYKRWEDIDYSTTLFGVFDNYRDHKAMRGIKKLDKCMDFNVIKDIYTEINNDIEACIKVMGLDSDTEKVCNLLDVKSKIEEDIKELISTKNFCKSSIEEINVMLSEIKDKHKIIVDKPKQHRVILEA